MLQILGRIAAISGCAAAACGGDATPEGEFESCETWQEFPQVTQQQIDVLVAVDTSLPGTVRHQAALAIGEALTRELGRDDVHVAVVSGDLGVGEAELSGCSERGDAARLLGDACTHGGEPFFFRTAREDGTVEANYGDLGEALSCALPEESGCEIQQPLEATARALEEEPAGFRRQGAYLSVVFVAGSDDCSSRDLGLLLGDDPALGPTGAFRCAELGLSCDGERPKAEPAIYDTCEPLADSEVLAPLDDYLERLIQQVAAEPLLYDVGVVAGNPEPLEVTVDSETGAAEFVSTCGSSSVGTDPPIRLHAIAAPWRPNNTAAICNPERAGELIRPPPAFGAQLCLSPDIDPADIAPEEPGIQLDCYAAEIAVASDEERPLPMCALTTRGELAPESPQPCWRVEETPACADVGNGLTVVVERHANPARAANLVLRCSCA